MHVTNLDHLVLTVSNIEKTCTFYEATLGMKRWEYSPGRIALHFGQQKINLHAADRPVDPNVRHATPGAADLCFLTDVPIAEIAAHLEALKVPVVTGPVERTGATGPILSVYCYDPDENLIEIATSV